jgi:ketosteroid isomerase-like protein
MKQQEEPTLNEQDRQQIDDLAMKYADAANKNDATAIASLFTEDGVFVTPEGILSGREAIEAAYQELFKANPVSDVAIKSVEIHGAGNLAWAFGQFSNNIEHGNWGAVDERKGDTWSIRMLTYNVTPPPATPA